ncbi:hypothetical protein [Jiulongibacter sp. NS-SX5]|uniref:hypothetical protein n=1 Tax=Jiulongibacter sp. NS-SX5 TaxID=3463854 RepID=UPI0040588B55
MKNLVIMLALMVGLSSCSKEEIVPLADQVSGSYEVSGFEDQDGIYAVPLTADEVSIDFTLAVSKVSDTAVDVQISQIVTVGGNSNEQKAGSVAELIESSPGTIDFMVNQTKIGTYQSGTFQFFFQLAGENVTLHCDQL